MRPYGAWASPISAARLAQGAVTLADLRVFGGLPYWLESRPAEGGRLVVMTADAAGVRQLTPDGFNARTRVHEYGGAPYAVGPEGLWFSNYADQRLYLQAGLAAPTPMTPEGYRYADGVPAPGGGLIAVREDHTDPKNVRNTIVRLSGRPGDAGRVLFSSSDFVAYPRLGPGDRLAWIAWDHPAMPWDATRLYVGDLTEAGLANVRQVAGGAGVSVLQPQWTADGALVWLSDEGGYWNLYEGGDGPARALSPREAEFAGPLWTLGRSAYAVLDDRIATTAKDAEGEALLLVDRRTGAVEALPLPFEGLVFVQALDETRIAAIAHSEADTSKVVVIDLAAGSHKVLRQPVALDMALDDISRPEAITFPSTGGRPTHALFYPPANGAFAGPAAELPPLIVQAHGGPTGAASGAFSLAIQYWTTRGFAVVDVDYGGSTGYGRAYRERLNGQWGVVDVEDVIAAAQHLADSGRVDRKRMVIHGGSAGGFTVLAALAQSDVFAAGGSFYGVADLAVLARDTHKFESRYMDGLIGPWPEAKAVYDARSPIHQIDQFTAPLLILQGADDPVVPQNQAHMIRDALVSRGTPVACLVFAGESHGWRRAETIVRAKEVELWFYGKILGFEPADDIAPLEIANLPDRQVRQ
ncbi:MAG TPA: prolyl oligopeptidase family serine peptidase [Phenylobacterium sp.]|nr:prolyl oligopeptidase family serine peptidase [Phenylobacterium sp.]